MILGSQLDTSKRPRFSFLEGNMILKEFSVVISEHPDSQLLEQDCLKRKIVWGFCVLL